ncbi:MAG: DUF3037 domain-containing protein [Carnobacterium sp.]|nr:DUF3037 domain-containing protein [Carnobacterium sp.]
MENTRNVAWYSVVRYVADVVKGEILNVGLIMNTPSTGEVTFKLIGEKNTKLKTILVNPLEKKIYKSGLKYLEFLLSSVDNNDLTFSLNITSNDFINDLKHTKLPNGFILTDKRFSKTNNSNYLFNDLLETYIGKKFIYEEVKENNMQIKKRAVTLIEQREVLYRKIKTNIKIRPIEEVAMNYNIDFGYEEKNKVNIIQAAPDKLVTANEWFQRISMISNNYSECDKIALLFNSSAESNNDNTISQMIDFLSSKDERIDSFNIFSERGEFEFKDELLRIEQNAGNIEKIEKLLIA